MDEARFGAIAILFVGGWSVLFLYHPKLVCRIFRQEATDKLVLRIQRIGAVEMAVVVITLIGVAIFGLNSK
jgi:uncharacterized membrane protein